MVSAIVKNRDTVIKTKNRSRFASEKAKQYGFYHCYDTGFTQ